MITEHELRELYRERLKRSGFEAQARMTQEECGELIVALSHLLRERPTGKEEAIEECADVYLMVNQMMEYLGKKTVMNMVEFKANKLKTRLSKTGDKDGNKGN